jgi:hypothetical protein
MLPLQSQKNSQHCIVQYENGSENGLAYFKPGMIECRDSQSI